MAIKELAKAVPDQLDVPSVVKKLAKAVPNQLDVSAVVKQLAEAVYMPAALDIPAIVKQLAKAVVIPPPPAAPNTAALVQQLAATHVVYIPIRSGNHMSIQTHRLSSTLQSCHELTPLSTACSTASSIGVVPSIRSHT